MAYKSGGVYARNFSFEVYLDSVAPDWVQRLDSLHVPCLISPLHDQDLRDDSDETKKPHYHCLLMYSGQKSLDGIKQELDGIAANGWVEVAKSKGGYARYLCHLDNPTKHQYSTDDVTALGGADYAKIALQSTRKRDRASMVEMMEYIIENDFRYTAALMWDLAHTNEKLWEVFQANSHLVDTFIKSYAFARMHGGYDKEDLFIFEGLEAENG